MAYFFSYWNPNGHYILNLSNKIEREIAITLIVQNKQVIKRISAGERADRSQYGNKSCFRGERLNGQSFQVTQEDWGLTESGVLEFDFINLMDRPGPEEILSDDKFDLLLEWFKNRYEKDKLEMSTLCLAF